MLAIVSNHFVRSNSVVVVAAAVGTSEVVVIAAAVVDFVEMIVDSNATNSMR